MNNRTKLLLSLALCAASVTSYAKSRTAAEAKEAAMALAEKIGDDTANITLASNDNAPFYIFSRGQGRGYIIVSGDDRTADILGYTDSGDYDYAALPEPLRLMLDGWNEKVKKLKDVPDNLTIEQKHAALKKVEAFKSGWTTVEPLCETHWHQSNPYNIYSPYGTDENGNSYKSITGCVATAASQIIYYFRKDNPSTTLYDTPTYSYGAPVVVSIPKGTPMRYDLMLLKGTGTAKQDSAVALLHYVIGTSSWLTYGKSTSGQASNAASAMNGQFNLSNNMRYKEGYSQQNWETMIYDNLSSRRPLLYTGVHATSGGHAVVLDGYQASTGLYHFNFGWGGQGDGYYTVDDETGMNNFSSSQSCVEWITPKNPVVSGAIAHIDHFYQNAQNDITMTVTNDGTLDFTGLYLYAGSTSSLDGAKAIYSNIEDAVPSGGSMTFTAQYRPTLRRNVYLFLCNADKKLLDSCKVEVVSTVPDLHLNSIAVDAGTSTVEAEGMTLQKVNNTTVKVAVSLTNGENGTFCQPSFKCVVEKYDTTAKEWSAQSSITCSTMQFNVGDKRDTVFTFNKLTPEAIYRVYLDKSVRTSTIYDMTYDTPDSIVFFTVANPDMTIDIQGRKATVGGTWNATAFDALDKTDQVLVYDLTAVKELNAIPDVPARNAIYITNETLEGAKNVVTPQGACDSLVITAGYPFSPLMDIQAAKASLVLPESVEPGAWGDVLVPFKATMPHGMQVRIAQGLTSTAVTLANVSEISAPTPVLFLKDRASLTSIDATDVVVSADTIVTACDGKMAASTVGMIADGTQYTFGQNASNTPYYLKATSGDSIAPFATVLYGTSSRGHRAVIKNAVDFGYMALADTLARAYDVLDANAADKGATAVETFEEAISVAETYFEAAAAEERDDVDAVATTLSQAIQAFLQTPSGIVDVTTAHSTAVDGPVEVYNIHGRKLPADATLTRGLYIIKRGNTVRKVVVR